MKKNITYLITCLILIFVLASCSKDGDDLNNMELGIWISLDKSDTLDFKTQSDFYKSNSTMQNDHYDYQLLSQDSIVIGYDGKMFVKVEPTIHKYSIKNNEMTIDLTNEPCYGFEDKIMTYQKE